MKTEKNYVVEKLGQGCSRKAYLMSNGEVMKEPRYNSSYQSLGRPEDYAIDFLMDRFEDDGLVKKVRKLKEKGFSLPCPSLGILAEYLVSKVAKESFCGDYLALCNRIVVRKRRNRNEIEIKGYYENAFLKEYIDTNFHGEEELEEIIIGDIHLENCINGYIVDYASIDLR